MKQIQFSDLSYMSSAESAKKKVSTYPSVLWELVEIVNLKNQQQYRLLQRHYQLQGASVKVGGNFFPPLLSCL
jgi:hypothetical protein